MHRSPDPSKRKPLRRVRALARAVTRTSAPPQVDPVALTLAIWLLLVTVAAMIERAPPPPADMQPTAVQMDSGAIWVPAPGGQ
jgi:hypothetical protein